MDCEGMMNWSASIIHAKYFAPRPIAARMMARHRMVTDHSATVFILLSVLNSPVMLSDEFIIGFRTTRTAACRPRR